MFVKQISVFLENTPGRLSDFTRVLAESGVDLVSLSIADTTHFGILRGIVADPEGVSAMLGQKGYSCKLTDVLAVYVPDRPGGLAEILSLLAADGVALEYMYSVVRQAGDHALIILRADQPEKAANALQAAGVRLMSQAEIKAL